MMQKLAVLLLIPGCLAGDWSYGGPTGPDHWGGACKGKIQSPIDINPRDAKPEIMEDGFKFLRYDSLPEKAHLQNTGYTLKYSTKYKKGEPQVSGGGLPGDYAFAQFHFHWGMTDDEGSEHTIKKKSYPLELHLVHFNTKYGTDLGSAIAGGKGAQDILAVLGIMFEVSEKDNKALEPLVDAFSDLEAESAKENIKLIKLEEFLPEDTTEFYRYNGSLTTPGCNEIVVWTVFQKPVPISEAQMQGFRGISKLHTKMQNNYRPVLPLAGRQVLDVTTVGMANPSASALSIFTILAVSLATAFINNA